MKNSLQAFAQIFQTGDLNYSIPDISQINCDNLLKNVKIDSKRSTLVNITNSKLRGFSNYNVKNITMTFNGSDLKHTFINGIIGPFDVFGDYQILREYPFNFNFKTSGNITGMSSSFVNVNIDFETYEKDSKKYINATYVEVGLLYKSGILNYTKINSLNNFFANRVIDKINIKFLKYSKSIYVILENCFNDKFKKHLNTFLAQYTYDQLLPENESPPSRENQPLPSEDAAELLLKNLLF
ncbi:uncharacterized protein LOC143913461 isoform X2 [Arctopsyche grandis]